MLKSRESLIVYFIVYNKIYYNYFILYFNFDGMLRPIHVGTTHKLIRVLSKNIHT